MKEDLKIVYITAPSKESALTLGRILVESRCAACVNILTQMTSLYWWENKITQSEEAVLLVKTSADMVQSVISEVEKNHPYSVACALSIPIEKASGAYASWLLSNLNSDESAKAAPAPLPASPSGL